MFKMCDFWMYFVNLGVLIRKGDVVNTTVLVTIGLRCNDASKAQTFCGCECIQTFIT